MPKYEYRCTICKKVIEKKQAVKNKDNCPDCPACGCYTKKIIRGINYDHPKTKKARSKDEKNLNDMAKWSKDIGHIG